MVSKAASAVWAVGQVGWAVPGSRGREGGVRHGMRPARGGWPSPRPSLQSWAGSGHAVGAGQPLTVPRETLSKQLRWTGSSRATLGWVQG